MFRVLLACQKALWVCVLCRIPDGVRAAWKDYRCIMDVLRNKEDDGQGQKNALARIIASGSALSRPFLLPSTLVLPPELAGSFQTRAALVPPRRLSETVSSRHDLDLPSLDAPCVVIESPHCIHSISNITHLIAQNPQPHARVSYIRAAVAPNKVVTGFHLVAVPGRSVFGLILFS